MVVLLSKCMCAYLCVCVCVFIYMYIYAYVSVSVYVCIKSVLVSARTELIFYAVWDGGMARP